MIEEVYQGIDNGSISVDNDGGNVGDDCSNGDGKEVRIGAEHSRRTPLAITIR